MSFPADYRRDASISVSAAAGVQQAAVICTEEQRRKLIELRERLLAEQKLSTSSRSNMLQWGLS